MFRILPRGLDEILSGFNKTLKELEGYVTAKKAENEVLTQEIAEKQSLALNNSLEIDRATNTINNINKLIN